MSRALSLTISVIALLSVCGVNRVAADATVTDDHRLPFPEYDNKTGVPIFFPRIVGGTPGTLAEFPGIASLQLRTGQHLCGGSVLADQRRIVTAAHCLVNDNGAVANPNNYRVMVDDLTINQNGAATRQLRNAQRFYIHPNYNAATLANDVAIVTLASAFANSTLLRPFGLSQNFPPYNLSCQVAGWGSTFEGGAASPTLQRVDVYTINTAHCNVNYQGQIPNGHFCAGHAEGGRDSCQGDSGGPLLCNGLLTGIVSFGYGCARPNFPGVYTNIATHRDWIMRTGDASKFLLSLPTLIGSVIVAVLFSSRS